MRIKKCPHCDNNIRLHPVKFPVINDKGGVIIQCERCDKLSYCEIVNPDELSISIGGEKIDTWDSFSISTEKALSEYKNIPELKEGIIVVGDLDAREYAFNFSKPHIYHCINCHHEVENKSKEELSLAAENISQTYDVLMNFVLANHRHEREHLIVEVNAVCSCGHEFISYWHKKFISDGKSLNVDSDLFLIGTNMPIQATNIDGIMSKNDCKKVLEKFIIRWNAIYPRLLIVTPFVGHQWLSKEEIIELWEWIKNFLEPEKTSLVTRAATFNKYKQACEEKGVSIKQLENYGLNNSIIQELTKKQNFHAKIYCGYSINNSEILMGSFNLMDGPSVENINFKSISYKNFAEKYISPMNISIIPPESKEVYWSRIFKQDQREWSAFEINSSEILNNIMKYE